VTDHRVGIADLAVGCGEDTLFTLGLGSCVAIVLYDAQAQVGGMAHVLLPDPGVGREPNNPARYPASAVPALLERMAAIGGEAASGIVTPTRADGTGWRAPRGVAAVTLAGGGRRMRRGGRGSAWRRGRQIPQPPEGPGEQERPGEHGDAEHDPQG